MMAWRWYVDPTDNQVWWTDDAGNFLPDAIYRQNVDPNGNTAPATPPAPRVTPPPGSTVPPGWDSTMQGLMGTNQQTFDEGQRQFNLQHQLGQQNQYSNLATSLLNGAASLRGPADYWQYANYLSGGKNIFDQLYGSTANPAYGGVAGYSPPISVQSILQQLGIIPGGTQPTGGGTPAAGGGMTVAQMRQELYKVSGNMGEWLSAPAAKVIAEYNRLSGTNYTGQPTATTQPAQPTATTQPAQSSQVANAMTAAVAPITSQQQPNPAVGQGQGQGPAASIQPVGTPQVTPMSNQAPNPWQINPIVWDSLSDTAKQLIISSAQAGNTPTGAWTPTDFLAQFNASRPRGTAPNAVNYRFGAPQSYF